MSDPTAPIVNPAHPHVVEGAVLLYHADGTFRPRLVTVISLWRAGVYAWIRAEDDGEEWMSAPAESLHEPTGPAKLAAASAYLAHVAAFYGGTPLPETEAATYVAQMRGILATSLDIEL